jgi:hypothetical protein
MTTIVLVLDRPDMITDQTADAIYEAFELDAELSTTCGSRDGQVFIDVDVPEGATVSDIVPRALRALVRAVPDARLVRIDVEAADGVLAVA